MTGAGFEPASANTEDLKSSPLDRSGIQSCRLAPFFCGYDFMFFLGFLGFYYFYDFLWVEGGIT